MLRFAALLRTQRLLENRNKFTQQSGVEKKIRIKCNLSCTSTLLCVRVEMHVKIEWKQHKRRDELQYLILRDSIAPCDGVTE